MPTPRTAEGSAPPVAGASEPAGAGALAALAAGSLVAAAASRGLLVRRRAEAEEKPAKAKKAKKEFEIEFIPRPEDLLESPKFPMFMGGTNGYMSKGTRERHAITWTAKEAFVFEMPILGVAVMNKGENLCYFRKKEQCIALGKQLRKMKIENYKIYRLKKDGTVQFMHPADGVFPEKVNKGRVQVNGRPFNIGQSPKQVELKYTKYDEKTYEADHLTTLFVKARCEAFSDTENLYALPNTGQEDSASKAATAAMGGSL
ncbi:unnamed protein product [Prorocentrum cordatum]|uniref:Photosystem I reaction center subunit II n=1 Tax=Prorocentrum cordatum TaxID=2364126 RepID=A0ABN9QN23_9DINO|nr:unnamed protein product [Polarella glacialis]